MSAINLSFDIIGDSGNNLVILHGLLGMGRNWAGIARALNKDRRVLFVGLRNHGTSPWADEMTYEAMAADVAHLINNHCDGKADIIGHSMGGTDGHDPGAHRAEISRTHCDRRYRAGTL